METFEEIQDVLQEDGTVMSFPNFVIYGLRESSSAFLRGEPSLSEVSKQEFNFYVSTKDCVDNLIRTDDTFTTSDNIYEYTFNVANRPIPFTDGWSKLQVELIRKELI